MGCVEGFEEHILGIRRPPEAVVTVHFLTCGEFGETDFPFACLRFGRVALRVIFRAVLRIGNVVSVVLRNGRDDGHRIARVFGCVRRVRHVRKIDVHQIRAGRIHDVSSVGADARVQHRLEFRFVDGDAARHAGRDIRQEQLAVVKPGIAGKRIGNAAHDGKVPKPLRTEQLDCQHQ